MELILILRILLRRWWLIVIPVIIVAVFVVPDFLNSRSAAPGGFSTVIRYSAAQELNIPQRDGDYQDVWLASELTVNALTAWTLTGSFREEVAQRVAKDGLEIDVAALGIGGDNERSVGQLFLGWSDADELGSIAHAAIDVLQTRTQAYFPQLGSEPAQVTLLDEPVIVPAAPAITDRFAPFIKLGLGLLAGLGLAFLAEYLDSSIRRREEIETLGLTVIATIPRHKR